MRTTEDTYLHKGMRKKMVDAIRNMGITDESVLTAMLNVPRHFFLNSAFEKHAYEEKAFLIGEDQTISHPYTVAFQTQLLQIKPFDKVLEVGTGSGSGIGSRLNLSKTSPSTSSVYAPVTR